MLNLSASPAACSPSLGWSTLASEDQRAIFRPQLRLNIEALFLTWSKGFNTAFSAIQILDKQQNLVWWSEKPESTVGRTSQEPRLVTKSVGLRQVQGPRRKPRPGSEQCVPFHKLSPSRHLLIFTWKIKKSKGYDRIVIIINPKNGTQV